MSNFFPPGQLLILPSRQAVEQERRRLLSISTAGVVLNPQVYHFGRLENVLAQELKIIPNLSDLGRAMIMDRLIQAEADSLGWSNGPLGAGLKKRIMDLVDQCKASGLPPARLLHSMTGPVSEKEEALVRIYSSYEDFLAARDLLDRTGARLGLLDRLNQGVCPRFLEGIHKIIIRNFNRLTPFQIELVKALSRVVDYVELHLTCPDWILNLNPAADILKTGHPFSETWQTIYELELFGTTGDNLELILEKPPIGRPPDLSWLQQLYNPAIDEALAPQPVVNIEVWAAPGRYAEIENIGRQMEKYITRGVSPEKMALAVLDLGEYGEIVEDVFRRFKLPLFFRRGAPLNIQAPVRALWALLRLAGSHWDRHLIFDVLASPYLDLDLKLPWPRLVEICTQAGVLDDRAGGGWEENLIRYADANHAAAEETRELIACLRRLKKLVRPLGRPRNWESFILTIREIFKTLKLETNIRHSPAEDLFRDAAAWAALNEQLEALSQAAQQAGQADIPQTPEALARNIRLALEDKNIGQTAGRQIEPGGIMVLNVYDLHGLNIDYLFLAGLNEGRFPHPRVEGFFLNDEEMIALNRSAGRRVLKPASADYRQQEMLFYYALSAAREKIVLSYCRTDEKGRLRLPSGLVDELMRLWPEGSLRIKELPFRVRPALPESLTQEELFCGLSQNLLALRPGPEAEWAGSVLPHLLADSDAKRRWEQLTRRVLFEREHPSDPEKIGAAVNPEILHPWRHHLRRYKQAPLISPSFLEEYGQCPFVFWVRRVLGLLPREEAADEISPLSEGSLVHRVLNAYFRKLQDQGRLPLKGLPEEDEELISILKAIWGQAEQNQPLGRGPLKKIKLKSMKIMLQQWLKKEQGRRMDLVPAHFEWRFGDFGPDLPDKILPFEVRLLSGGCLFFQGRVDRIDLSDESFLIYDYKLSKNKTKYNKMLKEIELGRTSFQAPLYQAVVSRVFQRPGSAAWILLRHVKNPFSNQTPASTSNLFASDLVARREMAEAGSDNFFNRLEETWLRLLNGDFAPNRETGVCDYCTYKTVCRAAIPDPAG